MQTSYIYSVSRVNALSQFLLSKTDIERLLVAEPGSDLQSALKETYLAPYIVGVPEENVTLAISNTLIEAKKIVHNLAPNGDMFRVLWVQYDIHNLRVFAKATALGRTFDECRPLLSDRGIYSPDYLYSQIESGRLNSLQSDWQTAYDKAVSVVAEGKIDVVDGIFDELYFETSKIIAKEKGDSFIKLYLENYIDLYNLKSRLRHLMNEVVSFSPAFVSGGSIGENQIETVEDVIAAFERLGGSEFWKEAVELFQKTGNFTLIDINSTEYLLKLAKEASYDMFTSASLVLYYLRCRQAAANIRSIVVGKNSGKTAADIRTNLRMSYVND